MKKSVLLITSLIIALSVNPRHEANGTEKLEEQIKVATIAHRGASGYAPENTIAAFDKAVEMKADYIEIDVQRSKDGELIIIHDTTVDRTTNGDGEVKDLTLSELKKLDAGSWKGKEFSGEKIPTFDEVLDRYQGKIGILIELKAPELYPGIEKKIVDELKNRNLDKPENPKIIIQSFNFKSMKIIESMLPKFPIGVLISSQEHTTKQALDEFSEYADYINPHYGIVTEQLTNLVHEQGMKISSWSIKNQETADILVSMKVDAIITDYPDYVQDN